MTLPRIRQGRASLSGQSLDRVAKARQAWPISRQTRAFLRSAKASLPNESNFQIAILFRKTRNAEGAEWRLAPALFLQSRRRSAMSTEPNCRTKPASRTWRLVYSDRRSRSFLDRRIPRLVEKEIRADGNYRRCQKRNKHSPHILILHGCRIAKVFN